MNISFKTDTDRREGQYYVQKTILDLRNCNNGLCCTSVATVSHVVIQADIVWLSRFCLSTSNFLAVHDL